MTHRYQTREELESAIHITYQNVFRIKEKLDGRSPIKYRMSTTEKGAYNFLGSDQRNVFSHNHSGL